MANSKNFWCNFCEKVVENGKDKKPKRCPECGAFGLCSHPPKRKAILQRGHSPVIIID